MKSPVEHFPSQQLWLIFALEMMAATFSTGVTCSFGFCRSKRHQQFLSGCTWALSGLFCWLLCLSWLLCSSQTGSSGCLCSQLAVYPTCYGWDSSRINICWPPCSALQPCLPWRTPQPVSIINFNVFVLLVEYSGQTIAGPLCLMVAQV